LREGKQLLYDGRMSALQTAIDTAGGQAALASLIGVKQQHVWNWLNRGNAVPPEHCAAIEQATGGKVTRRDLRPEDWARIWPELDDSKAAA
jgi:DNA-binding transcriptional regulator YdaS (Cro superfamily)